MQLNAIWLVLTTIYMTYSLNSWTLDSLWFTLFDSIWLVPSVYKLVRSKETTLSSSSCWIQIVLKASDQTRVVCSKNPQQNVGFRKAATRTQSLVMTWHAKSLQISRTWYGSSSDSTQDTQCNWPRVSGSSNDRCALVSSGTGHYNICFTLPPIVPCTISFEAIMCSLTHPILDYCCPALCSLYCIGMTCGGSCLAPDY